MFGVRKAYRELSKSVHGMQQENDQLKAENAKLRDFVRKVYRCSNIRCNRCEFAHGNTCTFDAEAELGELGIEVPDA